MLSFRRPCAAPPHRFAFLLAVFTAALFMQPAAAQLGKTLESARDLRDKAKDESDKTAEEAKEAAALNKRVPQLDNGIKTGEVTHDRAIVWVRLTQPYKAPDASGLKGASGEVRLGWFTRGGKGTQYVDWVRVSPEHDFTHQFKLTGLEPATKYHLVIQARPTNSLQLTSEATGSFMTAPAPDESANVSFTVVTGQDFLRRDDKRNGHVIYKHMLNLNPDFFVHTGDIVYYDRGEPAGDSVEDARRHWQRTYALPYQRSFHMHTPAYFIKDDHDTLKNDCWPGQSYGDLTFAQGLKLFREQVPMGEKTYRTVRWGRHLQIWLVEGRDFRSPNNMPDGPNKTIWGQEQIDWFKRTVQASDATFRVLISPTPIVGPDRKNKNDNHANEGFKHEGDMLRKFIASQKNMVVICGDRHWQYVSVDPETGVHEYSCGPTNDKHAGGFSQDRRTEAHEYLKVQGGFLRVKVDARNEDVWLTLNHYDMRGEVSNTDLMVAK